MSLITVRRHRGAAQRRIFSYSSFIRAHRCYMDAFIRRCIGFLLLLFILNPPTLTILIHGLICERCVWVHAEDQLSLVDYNKWPSSVQLKLFLQRDDLHAQPRTWSPVPKLLEGTQADSKICVSERTAVLLSRQQRAVSKRSHGVGQRLILPDDNGRRCVSRNGRPDEPVWMIVFSLHPFSVN